MEWNGMVWYGMAWGLRPPPRPRRGTVISFTTPQHVQRKTQYVKGNTSHTLHSLHSKARDMQRVPRSQTRIRVAIPGSTPGLNPCNHLAFHRARLSVQFRRGLR